MARAVCLHSGVFLRAQYLAFIGRPHPELAARFVRRSGKAAVEELWNGSDAPVCRIERREPLFQPRDFALLGHRHAVRGTRSLDARRCYLKSDFCRETARTGAPARPETFRWS